MIEKLLGENIIRMCDLLDKTYPENTPECIVIRNGLGDTITLFTIIGFFIGIIFILAFVGTLYAFMMV